MNHCSKGSSRERDRAGGQKEKGGKKCKAEEKSVSARKWDRSLDGVKWKLHKNDMNK